MAVASTTQGEISVYAMFTFYWSHTLEKIDVVFFIAIM